MRYMALVPMLALSACYPHNSNPDLNLYKSDDAFIRIVKTAAAQKDGLMKCEHKLGRIEERLVSCEAKGRPIHYVPEAHTRYQKRSSYIRSQKIPDACWVDQSTSCEALVNTAKDWPTAPEGLEVKHGDAEARYLASSKVNAAALALYPDRIAISTAAQERGGTCTDDHCQTLVPIRHVKAELGTDCWFNTMYFMHITKAQTDDYNVYVYAFDRDALLPKDLPYKGADPRKFYQLYHAHEASCADIGYWEYVGPTKRTTPNLRV